MNALANFCFLTAQSNLRISASDPAAYLAAVEKSHPGVLASQWIPTDSALWTVERYLDFLAARRDLLASAANSLLDRLGEGEIDPGAPPVTSELPRSAGAAVDDDPVLEELRAAASERGIAEPELHHEIVNDSSGELLALADLAWPDGVLPGRTQKVAFLLEADSEMEARLGELGYQFFVSKEALIRYLDHLLGLVPEELAAL